MWLNQLRGDGWPTAADLHQAYLHGPAYLRNDLGVNRPGCYIERPWYDDTAKLPVEMGALLAPALSSGPMRGFNVPISGLEPASKSRPSFLYDLLAGGALWHAWVYNAWYDILLRYRRTVIGPFWMVLSTGLMIGCLSLIAPVLFGRGNPNFVPYLVVSIISWNFIALSINELASTFIDQGRDIRNVRLPFSIYVYRVILRNLFGYAHLLTLYLLVAIIFTIAFFAYLPYFVLDLLLVLANFLCLGFLLGIICARFRDAQQVVASMLTISFILTPVFWEKSMLNGSRVGAWVLALNPLAHMLELLRAPLLKQVPEMQHYWFLLGTLVIEIICVQWLYRRYIARVVFWV